MNISRNNLYDEKGSHVYELNEQLLSKYTAENTPILAVFYAPWCGHCQRFAPAYMQLADTYISETKGTVLFGAINCVTQRDLCQTYGINGYPTIRTFGFGKTIDKEVKAKDIHSIGQVRVVLEDFSAASSKNTLRGKVKDLAHDLDSLPPLNTTDMHRSAEWIVRTINAAARVSSSEDRLHDALVSLRFLLQTEVLPSSLSTEKLRGVQSFLELVTALLPEGHDSVNAFRSIADWLPLAHNHGTENDTLLLSAVDIDTKLQSTFGFTLTDWRVCGVLVNEREKYILNEGENMLFSGSQKGYTCGLWLLFHYMTVSSARVPIPPPNAVGGSWINTHMVMLGIRFCVDQLFNCRYCRSHFVDIYDKCKFNRCDVKDSDYSGLQLWLWKVHNDVTKRIMSFHVEKTQDSLRDEPEGWTAVRWPNDGMCPGCYDMTEGDSSDILKFLNSNYWHPTWKISPSYRPLLASQLNITVSAHLNPPSKVYLRPKFLPTSQSSDPDSTSLYPIVSVGVIVMLIGIVYVVVYRKGTLSNCFNKRSY